MKAAEGVKGSMVSTEVGRILFVAFALVDVVV